MTKNKGVWLFTGGTPPKSSTAIVPITIIRNLNAPQFLDENVRATIPDNLAPGTLVTSVEARDEDRETPNNEVEYEISEDTPAFQYFFINPTSGEITLLASVLETEDVQYR